MLRYLTAGESHGPALAVVVEGLPAGLPITIDEIGAELARRRLGFGRGPRMRFERDDVEFLGGVRHGRHARVAGLDRDPQHRVAEVAGGDVARARRHREAAAPAPARPRRPRRHAEVRLRRRPQRARAGERPRDRGAGRRRHRWPRRCSPQLGTAVISHVVQMGPVRAGGGPAARPRRTSPRSTSRRCAASTPTPRRR